MGTTRSINKIIKSRPTIEGAGVHLKRAFGFDQAPQLDPFLLLDDFHSNDPNEFLMGFPWHPHRGIETITYVLSGKIEHGDSMGNSGVINSGDVQWMTAGSGIIHQEMPKGESDGSLWGFQLWANLPASHKMMKPRYREVKNEQIPEVVLENNVRVKVICGEIEGNKGPVQDIVTDPEYLDVTIPANTVFTHSTKMGYTVFAYVMKGNGSFDENEYTYAYEVEDAEYSDLENSSSIGPENLIMFNDGDRISVTSGDKGARFLLISGKPLNELIAWYGPIVMNTQEELEIAFEEYRKGTFIRS
ncbi:pirin family protein [Methanococcoides alaskense]|uniref:Redox-sensitive bicupin YhaK (Pirin superfamily) n=1 Tax=Methanococcoides alaskense TaxID=325778 RepID=A0AA90U227_9EURY|nr:pirin family protein [Methanococcoides alaskense]MDA0524270.1 pirin family protein [Methanococcoides alaskense]MDR6223779.1 redox-sensitive bicupin YhaK (pirin superfamily) [Methanococcoides alaskense]